MPATTEQAPARRYRIERYLTEGGMGAIYVGKKLGPSGFEKEVVLKQLLPEYTARPEFRDLFFREAKISATLDHTNIVHTFDLVESEESLFIVMEYVRGVDLRTIIRRSKLRRRELSPAAALHVTLEVLAGLSYAHTRRSPSGQSMAIIHRDVSPSNILCSAQGEVKLSDFGIAKAATHSSAFYRVRGKVGYMSPEQARNQPIDHRSDLYSVAVCLYEALTLERLFVGDLSTPADVIYSQPIVPPSQKRTGLPPALDVVLATALSADPHDRYQDAVALADALRQVAHRHGLLYSAPQLGEHLRYILGGDAQKWLNDDQAARSGDPQTQEIPGKKLEGKEAKSIGVVEGSSLYVVSGSDVVKSPQPTPPPPRAPKGEPARRVSAGHPAMDFPIEDDISEDPTKVRDPFPGSVRAPYPPAAATETPPLPVTLTPPPPVLAPPPPPPHPNPPARTGPPPLPVTRPARPSPPPAAAPSRPPAPESPFDIPPTPPPVAVEDFALTPPPLQPTPPPLYAPPPSPYGGPPGLPRPAGSYAPLSARVPVPPAPEVPEPAVYDPSSGIPSFPAPAQPLDFGPPPFVEVPRRSGPPALLVLFVLLGAIAGGAKLAQVVTRADVAALEAETASAAPAAGATARQTQ